MYSIEDKENRTFGQDIIIGLEIKTNIFNSAQECEPLKL